MLSFKSKTIIFTAVLAGLISLVGFYGVNWYKNSTIENLKLNNNLTETIEKEADSSQINNNLDTKPSSKPAIEEKDTITEQVSPKPALTKVKIFLLDSKAIESGDSCGKVYETFQEIEVNSGIANSTLKALFNTKDSAFYGYNEVYKSVNLKPDGTLKIDFKKSVLPYQDSDGKWVDKYNWGSLGTSCGSGALQEIKQTMYQFPSVNYVILSVEGDLTKYPADFVGCPDKIEQKPSQTEDRVWEEMLRQCGLA